MEQQIRLTMAGCTPLITEKEKKSNGGKKKATEQQQFLIKSKLAF